MILDAQNLFSQNQAVSATANATTDIDLGPIAAANGFRDLGACTDKLYLEVTASGGTGTGTIQASLITDTTSAFAASTTLWTGPAVVGSTLANGGLLGNLHIPSTVQKYLRLVYTVTGTASANITGFLTDKPQDNVSYAAGYNFPTGA